MVSSVEKTSCYTYKVEMIIQVLAKDQQTAQKKLESEGGYVTKRSVTLQDTVALFDGEQKKV
jgi:hypothetical protein